MEVGDFTCSHCNKNNWEVLIGHRSDGKTFLIVNCCDSSCHEKRREELKALPDESIIWEEFDITGQGYDENDILSGITYEDDDNRLN